ncbi:carboxymuconolactone decarboxylase family protein [Rhodocaloribacter sp.]
MSYLSYTRNYQGLVELFLRNPDRYFSIGSFLEAVMRKDSELSPTRRELVAAYVSMLNRCAYCIGSHEAVATAFGVKPEVLEALRTDLSGAAIDPEMRPIFEFAKKLTEIPSRITQADVQAILDAGWSEQTVEDVVGITSIFAFMNRLADGLGIKGNEESYDQAGRGLSQMGYAPLFRLALEQSA